MLRPVSALLVLSVLAGGAADAADAPRPGDQTVRQVCSACHRAGLFGAPRIGNAEAWSARLRAAGSVDGLLASAANGKNSMPPRGGVAELSDAELRAAIESMLAQSGVR
ncbi:MAG TPA: c-type cytochrome [Nevskia sp.]|nr:c-type cytochrome [Nevskia sp.]